MAPSGTWAGEIKEPGEHRNIKEPFYCITVRGHCLRKGRISNFWLSLLPSNCCWKCINYRFSHFQSAQIQLKILCGPLTGWCHIFIRVNYSHSSQIRFLHCPLEATFLCFRCVFSLQMVFRHFNTFFQY